MPRNGSGTYSLPQSPFVAGAVISSAAVNSNFSDIASALTGSLPRDGQAGMSGPLKVADGSAGAPSIAFSNESTSGFCRPGNGQLGVIIDGVQVGLFTSLGLGGISPIGMVAAFAGAAAPTGWVLCYGQLLSRTTYAALFAVIGTAFGSGDGTTFGMPDLRGATIVGKANMGGSATSRLTTAFYGTDPTVLGNFGGAQSKALITGNLPAYTPSGGVGISDPTHLHAYSQGQVASSQTPGGAFQGTPSNANANTSAASTGISAAFSGNAQGGASTAFSEIQPSTILNMIIYAGV